MYTFATSFPLKETMKFTPIYVILSTVKVLCHCQYHGRLLEEWVIAMQQYNKKQNKNKMYIFISVKKNKNETTKNPVMRPRWQAWNTQLYQFMHEFWYYIDMNILAGRISLSWLLILLWLLVLMHTISNLNGYMYLLIPVCPLGKASKWLRSRG